MLLKNQISWVHLSQLSRFLNYVSNSKFQHLALQFFKCRFLLYLQQDWFVVKSMKILNFKFQAIYKFSSILQSLRQVDCTMNHIFGQDQLRIFINLRSLDLWSKFSSLNVWFHLEETAYPSHQWIFLKKCSKVLKVNHFWLLLKIEEEL